MTIYMCFGSVAKVERKKAITFYMEKHMLSEHTSCFMRFVFQKRVLLYFELWAKRR